MVGGMGRGLDDRQAHPPKDEATDGAEQGETTDGEPSGESGEEPSGEGNNGDSDGLPEAEEDDEDAATTESTTA